MKKKRVYPRVMVQHFRKTRGLFLPRIMPKGGATQVHLITHPGVVYTGTARCCYLDTYNKKKGRSIAFGRLMKALDFLGYEDWGQTYYWIESKIGNVDNQLTLLAYNGEKIQ